MEPGGLAVRGHLAGLPGPADREAVRRARTLGRRYLGLADLIAFGALFIVTFAAARYLRDFRNRRMSRPIGVAVLAAETVLVGLAYAVLGPELAGSLLIYVGVMAVFVLPTRAGWAAVSVFVAVSLIVPWARGLDGGTGRWPSRS